MREESISMLGEECFVRLEEEVWGAEFRNPSNSNIPQLWAEEEGRRERGRGGKGGEEREGEREREARNSSAHPLARRNWCI